MSLIELPFIFTKRIEKLRIFSIIGIVGIVVFILGVVILFVLEIIDGVLSDKSQWSMFP
jgi:amino acid permease